MLIFDEYLMRWNLTPDGDPIITHSSRLLPVLYKGVPAMLKIVMEAEERRGGVLMVWWNGKGAARVLIYEGDALLMEREVDTISLIDMVRSGNDDEASRIICDVAAKLHAQKENQPPELLPLS